MNSRDKGIRGELELAHYFQERGYEEAARGQQRAGSADSPDVIGGPRGFHWECKRVERGSLYAWLAQAIRDAERRPSGAAANLPVVAHRRNRGEWIAILRLDDLMSIIELRDVRL